MKLPLLCILLAALSGIAQEAPRVPVEQRIMHWTPEQAQEVMRAHRAAARFAAAAGPAAGPLDTTTSVNLYPWLLNIPSERNQGKCGNCWAWGSTGVMEIALNVQNGIRDRFSVQFINSCNPYKACCDAGGLQDFVDFYNYEGFAIPWSNTGAGWTSGSGNCSASPCGNIATNPRYPISSLSMYPVDTWSGQDAAIANVKGVLNQTNGMYFFFYLPSTAAWNDFDNFFFSQPESAVWSNYYCGAPSDGGSGGHVVLCLGYYDDGNANRYWIMLNSWGPTTGRPTGCFRVSMTVDYNCSPIGFQGLNVSYALPPVITLQPQSRTNLPGSTATFTIGTAPGTPLTFQWKKNGANINNDTRVTGATSSKLTIGNVSTNDAGTYQVVLNYGPGTTNSASATLTVIPPPSIVAQPQSQVVTQGTSATFTVTASPEVWGLGYRWRRGAIVYPCGTNWFKTDKAGSYSVIVSNAAGLATSAVATLAVLDAQPGHFEAIRRLAGGPVQLDMSGSPGADYILEFTSNWSDWSGLSVVSGTNGLFQYTDPAATNGGQRFYRLRSTP